MTQATLLLDMYDALDEANPDISLLADAVEQEFEFFIDSMTEHFDEIFYDNGIALGSYDELAALGSNEDQDRVISLWQRDKFLQAFESIRNSVLERKLKNRI